MSNTNLSLLKLLSDSNNCLINFKNITKWHLQYPEVLKARSYYQLRKNSSLNHIRGYKNKKKNERPGSHKERRIWQY